MTTKEFADKIFLKLNANKQELINNWNAPHPNFKTRFLICDDLLPAELICDYVKYLPEYSTLFKRESMRERKRVGVNINEYDPIVGALLLAFQDERIVKIMEEITQISNMEPDPTFYASGISIMSKDDFLNPHLDNSHDGDQEKFRVINLLFYVTPDWQQSNGGNLELWDIDVKKPYEIHSKFNRLVVMETNDISYHSVNKITAESEKRVCVSNYYFSTNSSNNHSYKHITTFTGRPEEPFKKIVLELI